MASTLRNDLIYVSAGQSVLVYDYASGTQVQTLTYFTGARGSCSDSEGDVFVTNFNAAEILEFRHGGTKPIRLLMDPSPYPLDCSIDPVTGNLAVVNEYGTTKYSQGNVAIYTRANGKPKIYEYPHFNVFTSCGYDGSGNLIVSGSHSNNLAFAYLPFKHRKLEAMTLPLSYDWSGPAYVRWDGRYTVVGLLYQSDGLIFVQYTINGNSGTQEGSMVVQHSGFVSSPFWVGTVGGSKGESANTLASAVAGWGVYLWQYPAGSLLYELGKDYYGTGITVSPARR